MTKIRVETGTKIQGTINTGRASVGTIRGMADEETRRVTDRIKDLVTTLVRHKSLWHPAIGQVDQIGRLIEVILLCPVESETIALGTAPQRTKTIARFSTLFPENHFGAHFTDSLIQDSKTESLWIKGAPPLAEDTPMSESGTAEGMNAKASLLQQRTEICQCSCPIKCDCLCTKLSLR